MFWDLHQGFSDLDLWFPCTCWKVNKFIFHKSLTPQNWDWWIAIHWVFWDLSQGCLDLHLWFRTCPRVNKVILQTFLPLKVEIDESQGTESFEIFTKVVQALICDCHVPVSKSTNSSSKDSYSPLKVRLMDFKPLSLLRPLPRLFRPRSVIP